MAQTFPKAGSESGEGIAPPVLTVVRGSEVDAKGAGVRALRFGDFELAVESGELERDGEPVRLQPQPARLLQYLAERSGQTISRRELQAHLWGENRFVDSDQGLNYCVKSIRRALGDSAENPTYLETIPRRGYRFRAPVVCVDDPVVREVSPSSPLPSATPPAKRRVAPWLPVVLLAAAAAALGWALWQTATPAGDRPLRIAVLPFDNLSTREADGPLATGLVAELISRLVREHGRELGVIAQSSTMAFADTRASAAAVGAELDVDLLLSGTVQRSGGALRISTQLIDVADETVRWADVSKRRAAGNEPAFGDLATWTAEVVAAVAGELGLEPATAAVPAFELPADLYEVYLQGIAFSNLETSGGIHRGLATLAEVRRRAPGFAPAHVAWARLRARSGAAKEFLPEVMAALEHAVALDPDFAEARLEITRLRGLYLYEWRRGAEHVRRALELRPRLAEAHIVHAMYLAAAGRVDVAIDAMHQALVIDPLSRSTSAHLAWTYFYARRYERAIEVSRRTLEIDAASTAAHFTIIHSLLELGDIPGALSQARAMTGKGLADLEEFWRFNIEQRPANTGLLAIWQLELGDREAALDSLLQACHQQVGWPLPFLRVDARFDDLRQHPRFAEVLDCTGLAD